MWFPIEDNGVNAYTEDNGVNSGWESQEGSMTQNVCKNSNIRGPEKIFIYFSNTLL